MNTLKEHNLKAKQARYSATKYPKKNGIACDVCETELCDLDNVVLTSIPPKRRVGCLECGFRGYRT